MQGRFTSPDEFTGGPDDLFDFAEDASDNPTFYADLHEPQSLNKYQYAYNNPLRYVDPDGHGIKDWLKSAANTAGEFAGGVARGVAASMSYGTAPHSEPSSDDSVASRLGQVVGSALVIVGGSQTTGAGIALSGTGAGAVVGVPVAIAGVVAVAGGIVNASKVVTTPIHQKSGTSKADSPVTTADRTPGGVTKGRTLTDKQSVQRLRRGQDIDTPSKQKAKQLQKKASGGAVHDEAHRPGYKPHFHGKDRQGGHAFHDQ